MAHPLQVPEVLDENGNIDIHNRQGVDLLLGFEGENVSTRAFWFTTSGGFRKQLTNGGATDEKVLQLTQNELEDELLNKIGLYTITDETTSLHELIMEGQIRVRGF